MKKGNKRNSQRKNTPIRGLKRGEMLGGGGRRTAIEEGQGSVCQYSNRRFLFFFLQESFIKERINAERNTPGATLLLPLHRALIASAHKYEQINRPGDEDLTST